MEETKRKKSTKWIIVAVIILLLVLVLFRNTIADWLFESIVSPMPLPNDLNV